MKVKLTLFCALFFVLGVFAQNNSLFEQATEAYNKAKYEEAIDLYEQIIANGQHSAAVYFNLGNCHYKLNNIGPTNYYFEKALLLKPNDSEIRNNLGYAQNMKLDAIDTIPRSQLGVFYDTTVGKLSFDQWAYTAIALMILFVLAYLAYYLLSLAGQKRIAFVTSIVALILSLVSVVFAYMEYSAFNENNPAIIFVQEVDVRPEPNTSTRETSFTLHEGTKVNVLESLEDWKKIELTDGQTGWILSENLKLLKDF